MRRRDVLIGLATLAAWPRAARAQQGAKVRVGYNPGESLSEGLLAAQGGFFAKAGLDAELVLLPNGGAMTSAIVSGALDIAPSNIASIAAAYGHGLHLNLFAPAVLVSAGAPTTTIVGVLRDSPIRTARDLAGKTVALSTLRDLQQAAVMTWIDANGGDSKTVQFIEMPPAQQFAALTARRVDAALLVEPFLSQALPHIRSIARPYSSIAPELLTFGWIANENWYNANPALVAQVTQAIRATAVWANHDHDATAAIISEASKVPLATFHAMNRQQWSEGRLDPRLIQPIIDASVRYGFLPKTFAASELFAKGVS